MTAQPTAAQAKQSNTGPMQAEPFSWKTQSYSLLRWLLLLILLLLPMAVFGDYMLYVTGLTLIFVLSAMGLNIVLGYAGQITLAQAAFMGIGAYTVAILENVPYPISLTLGAAIGFVVGFLLGLPALRVRHHYLAMITLGFTVLFYYVLVNEEWLTGGALGISGIGRPELFASDEAYHVLIVIMVVTMCFGAHWLLNSQWGRAFKAIRENELRASAVGVQVSLYKTFAFAIGSALAAVAGGLLAPFLGFIDPLAFSILVSFEVLIMIVLGGIGRFEAAFFGAPLVIMGPEFLRAADQLFLLLFGVLGLMVLMFFPKGLVGGTDLFFRKVLRREPPILTK